MFPHHFFEVIDSFERYVVFLIAKIHECAGINAVFWNHDLDWAIWIDARCCRRLAASGQDKRKTECDNPLHTVILIP